MYSIHHIDTISILYTSGVQVFACYCMSNIWKKEIHCMPKEELLKWIVNRYKQYLFYLINFVHMFYKHVPLSCCVFKSYFNYMYQIFNVDFWKRKKNKQTIWIF